MSTIYFVVCLNQKEKHSYFNWLKPRATNPEKLHIWIPRVYCFDFNDTQKSKMQFVHTDWFYLYLIRFDVRIFVLSNGKNNVPITRTRKLENRIAIVTGSDSGIGQAIAIAFEKEGAYIVLTRHKDTNGIKHTRRPIHNTRQPDNGKSLLNLIKRISMI